VELPLLQKVLDRLGIHGSQELSGKAERAVDNLIINLAEVKQLNLENKSNNRKYSTGVFAKLYTDEAYNLRSEAVKYFGNDSPQMHYYFDTLLQFIKGADTQDKYDDAQWLVSEIYSWDFPVENVRLYIRDKTGDSQILDAGEWFAWTDIREIKKFLVDQLRNQQQRMGFSE
jgi:hypothetical protein